jgi:hypothetical protein
MGRGGLGAIREGSAMTDPRMQDYVAKVARVSKAQDETEERRRRVSLQRLRRAREAEQAAARAIMNATNMACRVENCEAELRVAQATIQSLKDALARAFDDKETYAAVWRIKAEEWEAKYKEAIETEGKKWERALQSWQQRYNEALGEISELEALARRQG